MDGSRLYDAVFVFGDEKFEVFIDPDGRVRVVGLIPTQSGRCVLFAKEEPTTAVGEFFVRKGDIGVAKILTPCALKSHAEELEECVVFLELLRTLIDEQPSRIDRQILKNQLLNGLYNRRVETMQEGWILALSVGPAVWVANCGFVSEEAARVVFARLQDLFNWKIEERTPHWAKKKEDKVR